MVSQPEWECIGQLGDASPTEFGGFWVFRDKTGVYDAEAEYLECPDDEDGEYEAYRFILEPCTFIDGVLSDNKYHPAHCVWFATTPEKMKERPQDGKGLADVCSCMDCDEDELIKKFCSADPLERAWAYREVAGYHGYHEFDDDPLRMTRAEVEERYSDPRYKV